MATDTALNLVNYVQIYQHNAIMPNHKFVRAPLSSLLQAYEILPMYAWEALGRTGGIPRSDRLVVLDFPTFSPQSSMMRFADSFVSVLA